MESRDAAAVEQFGNLPLWLVGQAKKITAVEDALDLLGSSGIAASMTWCVVCEVRYEEVQVMCSLHSLDFFTSFCRRRIVG